MGFLEDVSGDAAAIVSEQGEEVTHVPDGGVLETLTGVWDPVETSIDYQPDSEQEVKRGLLSLDPASAGSVTTRSQFTIRGKVFGVETVEDENFLLELNLASIDDENVGGANKIAR